MQPAEQTANQNKIGRWSHVNRVRMAPTAPQSKAFVIRPVARRPIGKSLGRRYTEMVQSDVDPDDRCHQPGEKRRPIVTALKADNRRVKLK